MTKTAISQQYVDGLVRLKASKSFETLQPYVDALERLVANKAITVPVGSDISNNTVAVEAGRSKGVLKGRNPLYSELREVIAIARQDQDDARSKNPKVVLERRIDDLEKEVSDLKLALGQSMGRELSLWREVTEFKKASRKSTGAIIIPLKPIGDVAPPKK
jgi:hypothetical protein